MEAKLIKTENNYHLISDNIEWHIPSTNGNVVADLIGGEIYTLSLNNCREIEYDFDLNDLSDKANGYLESNYIFDEGFKAGFEKALDLILITQGLRFSEENMLQLAGYISVMSEAEKRLAIDLKAESQKYIDSIKPNEWKVEILMEKDEPKSFVKRNVVRKLDNGEEIEWTCFWDNGWFDSSGVAIPNIISWERVPILDNNDCLILKRK